MVLSAGAIHIWGWADKSKRFLLHFNDQHAQTKAGSDGRWKIDLDPEKEGGPHTLTIKGKNTIVINDVLVGDVWDLFGPV